VSRHLAVGKQNYFFPKSEIQTLVVVCPARRQITSQNTICGPRQAGLQINILFLNYNASTNTFKKSNRMCEVRELKMGSKLYLIMNKTPRIEQSLIPHSALDTIKPTVLT